jgi:multiple sugar transport system permease protein
MAVTNTAHQGISGAVEGVELPRRRRRHGSQITRWLYVVPAAIYLALFFGYPIVKNITMSFQNYTTATFYTGVAPWVGISNYIAVIQSQVFSTTLVNTAIFTVGCIIGQFGLGLLLALFFRQRFPLNGLLRSLLLLPWLLPLIVSGAVWKWILDQDSGVLNQFLIGTHLTSQPVSWLTSPSLALASVIMVCIWVGIPFNAVILYGGLQEVPTELYEAASLDGATGFKTFRYVTWPLLRPVTNVVLVLGVVYTLKVIDIILALTGGGPANSTQTLATRSYQLSFSLFDFGQGSAMGNILLFVSLVFAVIYLRVNRRNSNV